MKNINAKVAFSYVMFLAIFFFLSGEVKSQPIPGDALDSVYFERNGFWFHDDIGKYHQKFDRLENLPPVRTDMPYEILLAYIYGDSLLRYLSDDEYKIVYRWQKEKVNNDTIKALIKYFYLLQDFNPYLLSQYKNTPSYIQYKQSINGIKLAISKILDVLTKDLNEAYSLNYLTKNDYILKVKIKNIIDTFYIDKSGRSQKKYYVSAYVLDTLKGKEFLTCNCSDENQYVIAPLNNYPVICFTYAEAPYTHPGDKYSPDPSILKNGSLFLQSGQELVISIIFSNWLLDRKFDYYNLFLTNAFSIIGNQVMDRSHIWSSADSIDYDTFKTIFFQRSQMILEGGY